MVPSSQLQGFIDTLLDVGTPALLHRWIPQVCPNRFLSLPLHPVPIALFLAPS